MGAISEGFLLSPAPFAASTRRTRQRYGGEAPRRSSPAMRRRPSIGEGTPFPRIVARDALQLFFGCGTGAITMYHSFECMRVPPFPLDVFANRRFQARCLDRDGNEITVETLVHNPTLHPGRIDSNPRLQDVYRDAILDREAVP